MGRHLLVDIKDKFNLLKIPVMKIYGNNLDFTELRKEYLQNQRYIIERSNSLALNNIVDVDYSFKFKKDISVDNMDLEITHSNITVRGNIINLTSKRINGVKLDNQKKILFHYGELLETKEVTINKIINSSELKTIDYSYSTSVTNGLGFFGYNIEYISYF